MLTDSGERGQNWGKAQWGGLISTPQGLDLRVEKLKAERRVSVCVLEPSEGSFIYMSGLTQNLGLSTGAPTCGLSVWFGFLTT